MDGPGGMSPKVDLWHPYAQEYVWTHAYMCATNPSPQNPVTQDLALDTHRLWLSASHLQLLCCPSVWLSGSLVIFSLLDNVHFLFSYSSQPLSLPNEKFLECSKGIRCCDFRGQQ